MDPASVPTEDLLARDAWLRKLAVAVAADDLAAADLAQETWLRALQARSSGPLRDSRVWLATLLHNVARNVRRGDARRATRERAAAPSMVDPSPQPFCLAAYEERRGDLVRAVEALPPAQRQVIVDRYWQGLEPIEIAQRNGEDPAAVRQRLRRAIVRLRARVDADAGDDRRTWLAPLLGSVPTRGAVRAAGVAGCIAMAGGLTMKMLLAAALSALVIWSAIARWPTASAPVLPPAPEPNPATTATAGLDVATADRSAGAARVALPPADAPRAAIDARFVLTDAAGAPLIGVAYWLDERPFRAHPGRAPEGAPRTGRFGRFDPSAPGSGDYVWFAIDDALSIAVERDSLATMPSVRAPAMRTVTAEIRSLPDDVPWRISTLPAWFREDDTDLTHGSSHALELETAGERRLWILRRHTLHRAASGPARVEFRLVDGLPAAFYCFSPHYEVEPEIQELDDPRQVTAHATRARPVFPFEIVEADGTTPHDGGGRVWFAADAADWSFGEEFRHGGGAIGLDTQQRAESMRLAVVLHDGELWDLELDDPGLEHGRVLRLVRGTGQAPPLRIDWPDEIAAWPSPQILVQVDGRFRNTSSFDFFAPETANTRAHPGAWVHDGKLVVQPGNRATQLDRVRVLSADGRVAHSHGGRLVITPEIAMQPIDAHAMIERFAATAGVHSLMLGYDVAWPGEDWRRVRTLRYRDVEGFGWRFAPTASIDAHHPLPAPIALFAPPDARTRLRALLRVNGSNQWIDVAHGPLR